MHHGTQPLTVEQLLTHEIRILISGSRGYANYEEFADLMGYYVSDIISKHRSPMPSKPVFITGKARTGADDLIIRWCKEQGYQWCECPADWNKHGKAAGMIRNREMGLMATHLIVFWDGRSKGTRNMLEFAGMRFDSQGCRKHKAKLRMPVYLVLVHIPKEQDDGWQSQSSREGDSRWHRGNPSE
jgi:hypothetical protein